MNIQKHDLAYLLMAFREAAKGKYSVNPRVGAIIVKAGHVLGRASHAGSGSSHAEALAIRNAADKVSGSTLYTTLEPCHWRGAGKKMPPCTDAIINAGIARVVVGAIDPNPHEQGSALKILRSHGVEVTYANMDNLFAVQNESYVCAMRNRRPFIHLKWAQTLDGYLVDSYGNSQWITDPPARSFARALRSACGSVLVGSGTARNDNPSLVDTSLQSAQPITRMLLDSSLQLPPTLQVFDSSPHPTIVFYSADIKETPTYTGKHITAIPLPAEKDGTLNLSVLLKWCADNLGANGILVEGGVTVLSKWLQHNIWDKVTIFVAPILFGDGKKIDLAPHSVGSPFSPQVSRWKSLTSLSSPTTCFDGYHNTDTSFGISASQYTHALSLALEHCPDV